MFIKDEMQHWINSNQLVRIEALKGRGVRQLLIGRIVSFDQNENTLLIYHEDEKQVYNIKLNEIETIEPAQ